MLSGRGTVKSTKGAWSQSRISKNWAGSARSCLAGQGAAFLGAGHVLVATVSFHWGLPLQAGRGGESVAEVLLRKAFAKKPSPTNYIQLPAVKPS